MKRMVGYFVKTKFTISFQQDVSKCSTEGWFQSLPMIQLLFMHCKINPNHVLQCFFSYTESEIYYSMEANFF